jgi:hypothetical protein
VTGRWLILAIVIAALALLFARKITQLALPGLGVPAKTTVIEPQCPTPEQKEVIERNLNCMAPGFHEATTTIYARNLLAMARTLGYPSPAWMRSMPCFAFCARR